MSERLEFVKRWLDGERVVDLCREYGVSRKTAYKMRARYDEFGPRGLFDVSRARKTQSRRTPPEIEKLVVALRMKRSTWGPLKLEASLRKRHPGLPIPSSATIGKILERNNLPRRRCRRKTYTPYRSPLREALAPNDIWCADFEGQFKLGNGRYCYPLTITDRHSRLILCIEALENAKAEPAISVFDQAFREHGLPKVIRTDNGPPFAARGLWALSRLSVRWLRLGIWHSDDHIRRIKFASRGPPGHRVPRRHLLLLEESLRRRRTVRDPLANVRGSRAAALVHRPPSLPPRREGGGRHDEVDAHPPATSIVAPPQPSITASCIRLPAAARPYATTNGSCAAR